jgi:hypothetical protein
MQTHRPQLTTIAALRGRPIWQVGLVALADLDRLPPALYKQSEREAWAGEAATGWALVSSETEKPLSSQVYRLPHGVHGRLAWYTAVETQLREGLQQIYLWRQGDPPPRWGGETAQPICATVEPATLAGSVEAFRSKLAPFSAQILQSLYLDAADDNGRLPRAAATLARAWLSFYERGDGPRNRTESANSMLLWRAYTLALLQIGAGNHKLQQPWAPDQDEELERAAQRWLEICGDPRALWLFQRRQPSWWGGEPSEITRLSGIAYVEARREYEVERVVVALVERYRRARQAPSSLDHAEALRAIVEDTALTWYLPRYNIVGAVRHRNALAEQNWLAQSASWIQHWFSASIRIIAGALLGYLATALSPDLWAWLAAVTSVNSKAAIVALTLAAASLCYFWVGIARQIRLGWRAALGRMLALWLPSAMVAWLEAWVVLVLFAPVVAAGTENQGLARPALALAIYALLTLLIGISTQLLFDKAPSTLPLPPP